MRLHITKAIAPHRLPPGKQHQKKMNQHMEQDWIDRANTEGLENDDAVLSVIERTMDLTDDSQDYKHCYLVYFVAYWSSANNCFDQEIEGNSKVIRYKKLEPLD